MPELTPAEEFRGAARIVREYAADAGPGWNVYPEDGNSTATFRWISLLSPALGEPLAVVFDIAARDAEEIGHDFRLLAVARLIRSQHEAMQGGEQS